MRGFSYVPPNVRFPLLHTFLMKTRDEWFMTKIRILKRNRVHWKNPRCRRPGTYVRDNYVISVRALWQYRNYIRSPMFHAHALAEWPLAYETSGQEEFHANTTWQLATSCSPGSSFSGTVTEQRQRRWWRWTWYYEVVWLAAAKAAAPGVLLVIFCSLTGPYFLRIMYIYLGITLPPMSCD